MTRPDVHEEFEELLSCLREEACDFVVVGAHALAAHGSPRATGDLDVLVRPSRQNAERVVRALARFGAPLGLHGVTVDDFVTPGTVYQMGLPPRRIDILTKLSGVEFDDALRDALSGHLGQQLVLYIGLDAMIRNKRAAGRLKDLADAAVLEEIKARRDAAR